MEEVEFERLAQKADEWEPALPDPTADGNYPAMEATSVLLARKIIRHRRALGLSRAELARSAGVRLQTLQRIEQGKDHLGGTAIEKIDKALNQADRTRNGKKGSHP